MAQETRIIGYPIEYGRDIANEFKIGQAEREGKVWTIEGFVKAVEYGEIDTENYYYEPYQQELYDSNITVNKIELASELAHAEIKKHVEAHDIYEETENGTIYCGEAQNIFDEYYDYYLTKIEETEIR